MPRFRSSSSSLFALALLLALVIAGGFVGFHSGGNSEAPAHHGETADGSSTAATTTSGQHGPATLEESLRRFLAGEGDALNGFLPRGVSDVSGMGGRGLNRQVRSHGFWFPVFDLSKVTSAEVFDPAAVSLNSVPLMITNPQPDPGMIDQLMTHRFTAVGGTPPYRWTMQIQGDAPGFTLSADTGDLSGLSDTELSMPMSVYVTDSANHTASASATLAVASAKPLTLLTADLPNGTLGQPYTFALSAEGGAQPYTWSLETVSAGWLCDPATGSLTATFTEPGDHDLTITLADLESSVQKAFHVRVTEGLEITTESPLPPAAPGAGYSGRFEATGGTPPYQWTVAAGQIPAWCTLQQDGSMEGAVPVSEAFYEFTLLVTDSAGLTFKKPFEFAVSQGLLAIPSLNKAGLAWQFTAMSRTLGTGIAGVRLTRNGAEIYRGTGTNIVDRNLINGAVYNYELTAFTTDGRVLPYASTLVKILPIDRQRGQTGVSGDPFADRVQSFTPLSANGYGASKVPDNVTGPPNGTNTFSPAYLPQHVASLHASTSGGGSIVLEFTDNIVESGPGQDFTVFENVLFQGNDPNRRFMEPAIVEVALFENQWQRFPCFVSPPATGEIDFKQPSYYARGFAGVNATTGEDPTNPARSGGDSFDLADAGVNQLQWIRFIRIRSTGDNVITDSAGTPVRHTPENTALSGTASSGFDLDGVSAVNY
ncbi:MAG: putative Ig domain-containing protein [Verrucomicrobiota bacterium]